MYLYFWLTLFAGFIIGFFACAALANDGDQRDEDDEYRGVDLAPEASVSHVAAAMHDENNTLQITPIRASFSESKLKVPRPAPPANIRGE